MHEPQRQGKAEEAEGGRREPRHPGHAHDECGVAPCPASEAGPERLADGGKAAASCQRGDEHEQREDLRHDAYGRLHVRPQPPGYPEISHGNGKVAQHHAELRHGERGDFPSGRHGVGVFLRHWSPAGEVDRMRAICQIKFY